jgi:uncharacterized RDD family membrane protein YckC
MDAEANGRPTDRELNSGQSSLAGRIVGAGAGGARRVAGATGIDQAMETAIEEAIVRAVESEAVERSLNRIVNGPLVANAVRDAMKSEAVEGALYEIADSELVDRLWARILDSNETQRLIERIAEAPEVRAAIASQGLGLVDDLGRGISRVTRTLDFVFERIARRVTFRPRRSSATDRVGVVTRALALGLDAIVVNVMMITTTALLGLIASAVGLDLGSLSGAAYAVGGVAWLALGSLYLFVFWSLSGQTPGMRFLDIRVEHDGERAIGPRRAFRRLVGFWLAAIPLCLGFLGVLLRLDRRGFHDRLGQTMVFYVNPAGPNQPHLKPVIDPMEESMPAVQSADQPIPVQKPVNSP